MSDFWDSRYNTDEYVYGLRPNRFFKETLLKLPAGKLLLPAEGEGRNAVFAARQGWQVEAFDISEIARQKALALAAKEGVKIDYRINGYETAEFPAETFDAIGWIYTHPPVEQKTTAFRRFLPFLKKGGIVIFEGFNKEQAVLQKKNRSAGGPKNVDMLFSQIEISEIFHDMQILSLDKQIITLDEGFGHQGKASVIRLIAKK
ncbi:MAG: class I SAM-dependent methyltransferase [Massilibacteroides sp.]|nr:class I SAM-dependent methyltransferase [Massilibacteroides sp.]MDD3061934.1 class I SAM-dependent methyltransferase [Massilibacteroides sp.]MDD4116395.1 class I SAM-dependent methyltransferase [Massilibacteroides sp.]